MSVLSERSGLGKCTCRSAGYRSSMGVKSFRNPRQAVTLPPQLSADCQWHSLLTAPAEEVN